MNKRNEGLDLIRAVAVILVLLRHMEPCPSGGAVWWSDLVNLARCGGWIGVDLFFVLSGYLVSGLLFQEWKRQGSVSVGRFLIRRGFKIYPPLWLLLIVTVSFRWVSKGTWDSQKFAAEILFVQNYWPGLWPHTWSLAVEEHFYLGLALLTAILLRNRKVDENPFRNIPKLFIVLGLLCLAMRILTAYLVVKYDHRIQMFPTHLRLDSLGFGVLLSWFRVYGAQHIQTRMQRWALYLRPASLLVLGWPFVVPIEGNQWILTLGFTLIYLAAGVWVWLCCSWNLPANNFSVRALSRIGFHSYSIYLWHFAVQWWLLEPMKNRLGENTWSHMLLSALYILASIFVGIAVAKFVEVPVLRLRDRWFPAFVRS
ncbi:acyltransferase family protein [Prosthecobacter fluviatilis]|uniref:Acyltransferase family protein n=1 Tax=Prosthecobacter fluviatilis TaxID=445931 RepID=A0ABW0KJJ5_9BACT